MLKVLVFAYMNRKYKDDVFKKENLKYLEEHSYLCANGKRLESKIYESSYLIKLKEKAVSN